MYFNVNFNVFFKSIKVHLLVSELYIYQNARCNDKKKLKIAISLIVFFGFLRRVVKCSDISEESTASIFRMTNFGSRRCIHVNQSHSLSRRRQ